MKLSFTKEYVRENFQKIVVFIAMFILIILAIKSGGSSISQQNVSTVVVPDRIENKKNPYVVAYDKCSVLEMSEEFTRKCVEWELKYNAGKQ